MWLTSGFLGEIVAAVGVVPVLGVNFLSEINEDCGSFLGEFFVFVGEKDALLFSPSSFSSSLFFIMASLELVLTGTLFFLGDRLITPSDTPLFRLVFDGLLVLLAAESESLFLGSEVGDGFSSELLRA